MKLLSASILLGALPSVIAWGAADAPHGIRADVQGHEIVATIAQIHLHPAVKQKLCGILPPEAKCHLAPVAAWADRAKGRYPNTAPMHYVNPKLDHPSDHCEYGEHGWLNEDVNVLTAIMNTTAQLIEGQGDIPLRFLVHFVGDMHQPLHLTGRDRGGNGAMFLFEGHRRNLHSVWDGGIITKKIRELGNYTSPLPSKQIESELLGTIFDPYVRFIIWEGLRVWWRQDLESWLSCPATGDPYPHSSINASVPASALGFLNSVNWLTSAALKALPGTWAAALSAGYPIPLQENQGHTRALLDLNPVNRVLARANIGKDDAQVSTTATVEGRLPACPYTWSKSIHELNCDTVWPKEYTGDRSEPLIELDSPAYLGKVYNANVVEKLLAQAGLRLAHLLNTIYGNQTEQGIYFPY